MRQSHGMALGRRHSDEYEDKESVPYRVGKVGVLFHPLSDVGIVYVHIGDPGVRFASVGRLLGVYRLPHSLSLGLHFHGDGIVGIGVPS